MPPSPSLFANIDLRDLVALFLIFFTIVAMQWRHKLPEPWVLKQYLSAINDRGGNILVLSLMSAWFFAVSVRIFYYAFELLANKRLDPDNAILLMGVQFVSNSAFGMCFGALLKTMTGSDSMTRGTDGAPGSRVTSQTTTRTDVAIPPAKTTDTPVEPKTEEPKIS